MPPRNTSGKQRAAVEILSLQQVLSILNELEFEHAMLVGGQAVLLYAAVYNLGNNIQLGVSGDIDLIAKASVAQQLAARLKNAKLTLAKIDDHTINSAVIAVDLNDQQFFQIDCLNEVSGLETEKILMRAAQIDLQTGNTIKIINPLDLLTSKLHNVCHIPGKRDKQGLDQARIAIQIARNYLASMVAENEVDALKAINAHIESCLSKTYVTAHAEYGLDAFSIIDELTLTHTTFLNEQLPRVRLRYNTRLGKHHSLLARRDALEKRRTR